MRILLAVTSAALAAAMPLAALAIDYNFSVPVKVVKTAPQASGGAVNPAIMCGVFASATPPADVVGGTPALATKLAYFTLHDGDYAGTVAVKVSSPQAAQSYVCVLTAWNQTGGAIDPRTVWTRFLPVSGPIPAATFDLPQRKI